VAAKESMEQLVPDLITFLLTHPEIKSLKQVSNTNMFLLCHLHTCLFNSPCLCKIASLMKYVDIALTAPARFFIDHHMSADAWHLLYVCT